MESFYSVTKNGTPCGKVSVSRQGLYFRFCCRCILDNADIYRLWLTNSNFQISLGILVPSEEAFVLTTKLPAKQLPGEEWIFYVETNAPVSIDRFIPIRPEEPFAYIARLKESFLAYRDDQQGIYI